MGIKELEGKYNRLQTKMHKYIDIYSEKDARTVYVSQELDKVVLEMMEERVREYDRYNKFIQN